jgi:hypothetical protein
LSWFLAAFFCPQHGEQKMRSEQFESVMALLREAGSLVPLKEIVERAGGDRRSIQSLIDHGRLSVWYELKKGKGEVPTEQFSPSLHRGRAVEIIKFLKTEGRAVRQHELMDTLEIPQADVQYITACLSHEYVTEFVSVAPEASCKICFHRGDCRKKGISDKNGGRYNGRLPEEDCGLWRDDWRPGAQGGNK